MSRRRHIKAFVCRTVGSGVPQLAFRSLVRITDYPEVIVSSCASSNCLTLGVHSTHPHWLRDTIAVYCLFRNSLRLACGSRSLHRQFTPPRQLFPCPAWVLPGGQPRVDREPRTFFDSSASAGNPLVALYRVLLSGVVCVADFLTSAVRSALRPECFSPVPIAAWERQLLRVR